MHRCAPTVLLVIVACLTPCVSSSFADDAAIFEKPVRLQADGNAIDTGKAWGHSGPCLADVDGDGLRDLVVGDFSGKFRVYRNLGSNNQPKFGPLTYLMAGGAVAHVRIYCCIGSSPHFVDFDGDGHLDMISGSYDPGECYLFRGLGQGKFAARQAVVDKTGKPLMRNPTQRKTPWYSFGSWPVTVDWDADGDLDLLIGGFDGSIHLYLNQGTRQKPQFESESLKVQAAGKDLEVPAHHAAPAVVDWDGDGRWDILSGSTNGGVYWYRNVGKRGAPEFLAAQVLVKPHVGIGYDEFVDVNQEPVPGIRSQIAAEDYDGDGRVDLLLGDFRTTFSPKPNLSSQERTKLLATVKESDEIIRQLWAQIDAVRDDNRRRYPGEKFHSEEANAEFQKAYRALIESKQRKELESRLKTLGKAITPLLDRPEDPEKTGGLGTSHGYVWFFRRKPVDSGSPVSGLGLNLHQAETISLPKPTSREPVVAEAAATPKRVKRGDLVTLTIQVSIAAGWHIQTVGARGLSIPTRLDLKLPAGITSVGDWEIPAAESGDPKTGPTYQGEVAFHRKLKIADDAPKGEVELKCELEYQACDEHQCLRPTKTQLIAAFEVLLP